MALINIAGIVYELSHENRNGWNIDAFRNRYSEVLKRYDYIVGDWGYNQLRLKGFFKEGHQKATKDTAYGYITDYINEYCNFGCPYFILEKKDEQEEISPLADIIYINEVEYTRRVAEPKEKPSASVSGEDSSKSASSNNSNNRNKREKSYKDKEKSSDHGAEGNGNGNGNGEKPKNRRPSRNKSANQGQSERTESSGNGKQEAKGEGKKEGKPKHKDSFRKQRFDKKSKGKAPSEQAAAPATTIE